MVSSARSKSISMPNVSTETNVIIITISQKTKKLIYLVSFQMVNSLFYSTPLVPILYLGVVGYFHQSVIEDIGYLTLIYGNGRLF